MWCASSLNAMRPECPAPAVSLTGGILPLRVSAVGLSFNGIEVLAEISFELQHGGPTVLLGPNGAGKTLLLKLCHGLLSPTCGSVQWRGTDSTRAVLHQAMVFQQPVLLRRSVAANVDYALATRRLPRRLRQARVARVLDATGLAPLAKRAARLLSGGEQQRLALARAWALEPQVLFLDEPTANLDPAATRAVEHLIMSIAATGTKVMFATHDLLQAKRLASEILVMHRGRLLERSTAPRFFAQPASDAAHAFVRGELWW